MLVWHSERYRKMNENNIRKYAGLMAELDLTGLEITDGETKVRLERGRTESVQPAVINVPDGPLPSAEKVQPQENSDYISVKSPMVGVFYAAPAENADPFVSVGQRVDEGATLCIIEAMKLMNEIGAEESGVIDKVCVDNGQVVEYGTELFRIRRQ